MRILPLLLISVAAIGADPDGSQIYRQRCSACHESPAQSRAPAVASLRMMSLENVVRALESGLMKEQGASLNAAEKRAVAEFVTAKTASSMTAKNTCADPRAALAPGSSDWIGWGNGLNNARFQASPGFSAADVPRLKLKWAFTFPDSFTANAQPSIFGGRVFVASANRRIYSLDMRTACEFWSFESEAPARTAISVVAVSGGNPRAFFADRRGNVYALDATNGELLWKTRALDHPRAGITGAPVFHDLRLIVPVISGEEGAANDLNYECCKARGAVVSLDV